MDITLQLIKILGAVTLVLTLLWGATYALKRWGGMVKGSDKSWIHVLERRYLGPKHSLLLVRVAEETVLLGLSPQGISFLTSLDVQRAAPAGIPNPEDESP